MTEPVYHMDGPAQPCGPERQRQYLPGNGAPSCPKPSAETSLANASARVSGTIEAAEKRIAQAADPIDRALIPFWQDVVAGGRRALAIMEEARRALARLDDAP